MVSLYLSRRLALNAAVIAVMVATASAEAKMPVGELNVAAGGRFPQGSFTDWADNGVSVWARTNVRPFKAREFSGWVDVDFTQFSTKTEPVVVVVDDTLLFPSSQKTDQYSVSFHPGVQVGSGTNRGFFRPRAAIAPGIYFFSTETSVHLSGTEEEVLSDALLQVRFGWRGVVGTDLYFVSKWGISLDFTYEAIWNLHQATPSDAQGQSASFDETARHIGFMVGVVIPFSSIQGDEP